MNDIDAGLRRRMILRAAKNKEFVAYALALCARSRGQALEDLCQFLGCDETGFFRLSLCRRPEEDVETFRRDVVRIASFVGVDAGVLANLLREASFIAMLPDTMDPAGHMLWAAREQDDRFGPSPQPTVHQDMHSRRNNGRENGENL